jgi:hypothetical protein
MTERAEHILDRSGAEGADQLVLEVRDAHEEAQPFKIRARQARSKAGPLQGPLEVALLCHVTEACDLEVEAPRAVPIEVAADGLRTADRKDGNSLGFEVPSVALGQRLDGELIADSFDQHDRTHGAVD